MFASEIVKLMKRYFIMSISKPQFFMKYCIHTVLGLIHTNMYLNVTGHFAGGLIAFGESLLLKILLR